MEGVFTIPLWDWIGKDKYNWNYKPTSLLALLQQVPRKKRKSKTRNK